MKFKALEIYVGFDDHNASMLAIEKKADAVVNDWLEQHPTVTIHHVGQSLADINGTAVCQIGIFYSEE